MLCGEGLRVILAIEFDWKFADPEAEQLADKGTESSVLWEFKIQITLTSRIHPLYRKGDQWGQSQRPPRAGDESAPCNWAPLAQSAFQPKQYSVRLEKGRFIEPFKNFHKKPFPLFQPDPYGFAPDRYAYRLWFNTSPFPVRDEWQPKHAMQPSAAEACLNYCRFWEYREFVWTLIPKSEQTWVEILDLNWWLSPSKGGAHNRTD